MATINAKKFLSKPSRSQQLSELKSYITGSSSGSKTSTSSKSSSGRRTATNLPMSQMTPEELLSSKIETYAESKGIEASPLKKNIQPASPSKPKSPLPPPPAAISSWKSEYEQRYYKKPLRQVAQEFASISAQNIKTIPKRDWSGMKNPWSAFEGYGRRTSEIISPQYSGQIKSGTISPKEPPIKTYGELQKEQDIDVFEREQKAIGSSIQKYNTLRNDLQESINNREISIEDADKILEEEADKVNKDLAKQKQYSPPRYYEKGVQTGNTIAGGITSLAESAAFLTPGTSALMGAYKASEAEKGGVVLISDVKKGVPLYPDTKVPLSQQIEASSFLIGGGLGALAKTRTIEKQLVETELKKLTKKPVTFNELIVKKNPESQEGLVFMKGTSGYRGLTREVEVSGKLTKLPGGSKRTFFMPEAAATDKISGELSWSLLGRGKPTYIAAVQESEAGAKGLSFPIGKGRLQVSRTYEGGTRSLTAKGKAFGTVGTGTVVPESSTSLFYQTKYIKPSERTVRKEARALSQTLTGNTIYGGQAVKELSTAKSLRLNKNLFFTATEKKDAGFTKIIYPEEASDINRIFGASSVKKTPLAQTFKTQSPQKIVSVSKTLEKPLTKTGRGFVKNIMKSYPEEAELLSSRAGLGLSTVSKEKQREGVSDRSLLKTRDIFGFGEQPSFKSKPSLRNISVQTPAIAQITQLKPRLEPKTATDLGSSSTVFPVTPIRQPQRIIYPEDLIFGFDLDIPQKEKRIFKTDRNPYIPQAYIDATKGTKAHWRTLGKPTDKATALSIASRFVDNTISARGRVTKAKGKIKDFGGDNYFEVNRDKFRTFQQKRGRRTQLPNSFIERQRFRADNPNEVIALQTSRRRTPFGF